MRRFPTAASQPHAHRRQYGRSGARRRGINHL